MPDLKLHVLCSSASSNNKGQVGQGAVVYHYQRWLGTKLSLDSVVIIGRTNLTVAVDRESNKCTSTVYLLDHPIWRTLYCVYLLALIGTDLFAKILQERGATQGGASRGIGTTF